MIAPLPRSAPPPLFRSLLAVPGNNPRFIEKAAVGAADAIFFDLEDSVPVDQKDQARRTVIAALNELAFGDKSVSVRINALDTPFMYRDLIDLAEQAGDRLHAILVPKVGRAAEVVAVDLLLSQIEAAKQLKRRIGIDLLIESALGMRDLDQITVASPRLRVVLFGAGDYAASLGARAPGIGLPNPDYAVPGAPDPSGGGGRALHWGDQWHYALSRIVVAARAAGLLPVDGPFADVKDADGCTAAMRRAAALGCEGKMVIHPGQIALANQLFAPSETEVAGAGRVLAALAAAERDGRAAVTLDGRMIDLASIRHAEAIVAKAKRIAGGIKE